MKSKQELLDAYKVIVDHLKSGTQDKNLLANFEGTEERCVKALTEMCLTEEEINKQLEHILSKVFPINEASGDKDSDGFSTYNRNGMRANGMVTQGPIAINSMCPHHLMPVRYEAYVSYIPKDGQVLGLSKLARISKLLGKRPVLHEQLASDIADVLCAPEYVEDAYDNNGEYFQKSMPSMFKFKSLRSAGSAVCLVGTHTCECCRGVEEDARTEVTEMRGNFIRDNGMEGKFYQAVNAIKQAKPF